MKTLTLFTLLILTTNLFANEAKIIKLNSTSQESLSRDSIRVLVWNIYKGKKRTWHQDFEALADGKDIIMLQEFVSNNTVMSELSYLSHLEQLVGVSFYLRSGESTGVATLGRASSTSSVNVHSIYREPITNTPKATLITTYKIDGHDQELMVINIHGINFTTDYAFAKQLDEIYLKVNDHQGPMIFAGDFNTWSKDRTIYLGKVAAALNLASADYLVDERKKFLRRPLDHLLFRGLKQISATTRPDLNGSDHPAIEAEFSLSLQ